ncbi:UNVERIFIED_CONTAM: galactose mutarotase [Streptococcus canis]
MKILEQIIEKIGQEEVIQITLMNDFGVKVECLTFGATWQSFKVLDGANEKNIVLGHQLVSDYLIDPLCAGQSIGRVAGRIGGATFRLNNQSFTVEANEKGNCLHGGSKGFHKRNWHYRTNLSAEAASVTFLMGCKESDDLFPGDMDVCITYTLTNANQLDIVFEGNNASKLGLFNPTNHVYFNLSDRQDLTTHSLQVASDDYLETDGDLIPTGRFLDVSGRPHDFREKKALWPAVIANDGFDTAFRIRPDAHKNGLPIAVLRDEESNTQLSIFSDRNALVIYTMDDIPSNLFFERDRGQTALPREAIAMEAQTLPDAINHAEFGDITILPNEKKTYRISYHYN